MGLKRGVMWAAICSVLSGPAPAQSRLSASWIVMVEACLGYAETGQRSVFADWYIAADGGGVCHGDPACEDDDMTFIAPGPNGVGAVNLRVGAADWVGAKYHPALMPDRTVGDLPSHAFCGSARGTGHQTGDIDLAHRAWLTRQRAAARLHPAEGFVSVSSGPYVGCGYDGRMYLIEFSLARPGPAVARLNYPTRFKARDDLVCQGLGS